MTVTVASRLMQGPAGLSNLGRLALAFIDGGMDWMQWAVSDPGARYELADETALLMGAQIGLHNAPLALLPNLGLLISPMKLMTLGVADLTILAQAERGDAIANQALLTSKIFADHGLVTQAELAAGLTNLTTLEVQDAPVFQAANFEDRVALASLLRLPDLPASAGPLLQKEAAAFGVAQGRSPMAFVDFYKAYLYMAAKSVAGTAEQRLASANAAVTTLQPLLLGALDCPQVNGMVAPAAVAAAVKDWLMMGRQVGFARLSQGVLQIIAHTKFTSETGEDARSMASAYFSQSQALLSSKPPSGGVMSQDGGGCVLPVEGAEHLANLHLDSGGAITLSGFRKRPGVTAAPPPAPVPVTAKESL